MSFTTKTKYVPCWRQGDTLAALTHSLFSVPIGSIFDNKYTLATGIQRAEDAGVRMCDSVGQAVMAFGRYLNHWGDDRDTSWGHLVVLRLTVEEITRRVPLKAEMLA